VTRIPTPRTLDLYTWTLNHHHILKRNACRFIVLIPDRYFHKLLFTPKAKQSHSITTPSYQLHHQHIRRKTAPLFARDAIKSYNRAIHRFSRRKGTHMQHPKQPRRLQTALFLLALIVCLIAINAGLSLHSIPYTAFFIVAAVLFAIYTLVSFFQWDSFH
jgi:hypothetical protein